METVFFLLTVLALFNSTKQYSYTGERSIRSSVLSSFAYDRMARPATRVDVYVSMTLITIVEFDTDAQQLICTGWFTERWIDDRLMWAPSRYDNTEYIHAVQGEVWKPELLIDNTMYDVGIIGDDDLIFKIKYTGDVWWEPAHLFQVHCSVDMTFYPFDQHTCTIELRSWGLNKDELVLISMQDNITIDDFRENAVWELLDTEVYETDNNITVNGTLSIYTELDFSLKLKRRTSFYIIHTFVPIVTTSFLAVIVFLVPPESGEKMTYSLTVFLCIVVLDTIYLPQIPDSSAYLAMYLAFEIYFAAACTLVSAMVLALHHRSDSVKMWLLHHIFLIFLKYLTLWTPPADPPIEEKDDDDDFSLLDLPTDDLKKIERKSWHLKNNSIKPELEEGFTEHVQYMPPKSAKSGRIDPRIYSSKAAGIKSKDVYSETKNERPRKQMKWSHAAMLYDRLMFVVALALTITYNVVFIKTITLGIEEYVPN